MIKFSSKLLNNLEGVIGNGATTIWAANLDDSAGRGATKTQPTTNERTMLGLTGGLEESQKYFTGEERNFNSPVMESDLSRFLDALTQNKNVCQYRYR